MRSTRLLFIAFVLPVIWGCIKEITADIPQGPVRLVVEGRITDQPGPYVVRLSETRAFNDSITRGLNRFSPAVGATVQIVDDLGNGIFLKEGNPGIYKSGPGLFRGEAGRSYQVIIRTRNDKTYISNPELMLPVTDIGKITVEEEEIKGEITPPLTVQRPFNPVLNGQPLSTNWRSIVNPVFVPDVSAIFSLDDDQFAGLSGFILGWFNPEDNAQILDDTEILAGLINDTTVVQADLLSLATVTLAPSLRAPIRGFRIKVASTDPAAEKNHYRWTFKATFSVDTHPERYSYLAVNRQGTLQYAVNSPKSCCSQCWFTFEFDDIILMDDRLADGNDFVVKTILVPLQGMLFDQNFHIEVQQTSITSQAFRFLQAIKSQSESVGSIFDATPAVSRGNISNVDDPSELVLGYFLASAVSSRSMFLGTPTDIALQDEFVYFDDCRAMGNSRIEASTIKPDFWPN